MSKAVITILLIVSPVLSPLVTAQVYFDNLYGLPTTSSGIGSGRMAHFGDGYLIWSSHYSQGRHTIWGFTIDEEGYLTDEIIPPVPDSISEQPGNIIVVNDTMLVGMSYQRVLSQPSSAQGDMVLTCLSPQGQIYWRQVYGLSDRMEIPIRAIRCSDGGYAITGQVVLPQGQSGNGMMYLIRTDSLGNQLWEQSYGGSLYESGRAVIQTSDDGFLQLGWTRSFGAGQRDFYLVKTDSLGNQQWQRTYGGSGEDNGAGLTPLSDGNYLLYGASQEGGVFHGMLCKVTSTGNVIWSYRYAYQNQIFNDFFSAIQLPDESIVATGGTDAPGEGNAGWLVKVDSEGNELWQRKFNKNQYTDLFYTMLTAEDGGFLLGGQAVNLETMSQDAWLLKVDSVGCAYPNCLVGIDEKGSRQAIVDVWPSPCTDVLHFELSGNSAQLDVQVLDMQGREVLRHKQHEQRATLNVADWPSGAYVLRGMDGSGRSFSMKVVKQ